MTHVVGSIRPTALHALPALKLRGARFRRKANAQAVLGALEQLVEACDAERFADLVAVYAKGKPLYVNQLERFAGPEAILDAIGGSSTFEDGALALDLYLRRESDKDDGYARLKLGGGLDRPSFRLVCEWRDRRWRGEGAVRPQDAYRAIVERAKDGAIERFAAGCRAGLEALSGRIASLLAPPGARLDLDASVVVPGPPRLGRLRHVDFEARPKRRTRLSRGDPPPTSLLESFHDDPFDDFVSWALFDSATRGIWTPSDQVRFVRSDAPGQVLRPTAPTALGIADGDIVVESSGLKVGKRISHYQRLDGDLRGFAVPGWGGDHG